MSNRSPNALRLAAVFAVACTFGARHDVVSESDIPVAWGVSRSTDGSTAFVLESDGRVHGVHPTTGAVLWSTADTSGLAITNAPDHDDSAYILHETFVGRRDANGVLIEVINFPALDVTERVFCDVSVDSDGDLYLSSRDRTEGRLGSTYRARIHRFDGQSWTRADVPDEAHCGPISADPFDAAVYTAADADIYRFSDDLLLEASLWADAAPAIAIGYDLDASGGNLLIGGISNQIDPAPYLWLLDGSDGSQQDAEHGDGFYAYGVYLSALDGGQAWGAGEHYAGSHSVLRWDLQ